MCEHFVFFFLSCCYLGFPLPQMSQKVNLPHQYVRSQFQSLCDVYDLCSVSQLILPIKEFSIRHEGSLIKQGAVRKNWKTRWMSVGVSNLYYFENEDAYLRCKFLIGKPDAIPATIIQECAKGTIPLKDAKVADGGASSVRFFSSFCFYFSVTCF
jgi:hypothetical protein